MPKTPIVYMSPLYLPVVDNKQTDTKLTATHSTQITNKLAAKKKHSEDLRASSRVNAETNRLKLFRAKSAPAVMRTPPVIINHPQPELGPLTVLNLMREINAKAAAQAANTETAAAAPTLKKVLTMVESPHQNTHHEGDFTHYKFGNSA
jgi:hypothetical protein